MADHLNVVPAFEQDPGFVSKLRLLADMIENGEIIIEQFYFVAHGGVENPVYCTHDSGLTISEAVFLLEREKFRILSMAES